MTQTRNENTAAVTACGCLQQTAASEGVHEMLRSLHFTVLYVTRTHVAKASSAQVDLLLLSVC